MKRGKNKEESSRNVNIFPGGKSHSKSKEKMTIGVYLPKKFVERARNRNLSLSRVTEQAL